MKPFDWTNTPKAAQCAQLQKMDEYHGTSPYSPLHHDQQCPIHGTKARAKEGKSR